MTGVKSTLADLREPTCCCIGVRKLTFALAFIQASTLIFSLAMAAIGLLRDPNSLVNSFGYYVTNHEMSLVSVSVSGDAYSETVAVEFMMNNKVGDNPSMKLMEPLTADEVNAIGAPLASDDYVESSEPVNGIRLHIIEEYEVAAIPPCHAWREVLLVLALVSTACCFTVLALVGVMRAKPTYLLPYCCVHLCDLILTAGTLLTACAYMRCKTDAAREWLATQRYVMFDEAVHKRLLRLSETELQAILVLAGSIVFGLKVVWFSTVCRCYSYLVKLKKRRMLLRCGEAGVLSELDEKTKPMGEEQTIYIPQNMDEKLLVAPPPDYDEIKQEKLLLEEI